MDKFLRWLDDMHLSYSTLCEEIGLKAPYLSRVINGKQDLGINYVEKIYVMSEGDIGLKDLRPDLYEKYKKMGCIKNIDFI